MADLLPEAAIYQALADRVSTVAAALTPSFAGAIAFPNAAFTPPRVGGTLAGKALPYLAVTYMPNASELDGLAADSGRSFRGLLQISVFWPASEGIVKPMQVAAQIAAAFAPGPVLVRPGVEVWAPSQDAGLPTVAGALQETDLTQIPVTIRWTACASAFA